MSKRQRQQRYKTTGGASDLVKVETLVPAGSRAQVLDLAARLREEHRRRKAAVASVVAKVRAASAGQPRRYAEPQDIDRIVAVGVNVPFPRCIDAPALAESIRANTVPAGFEAHVGRFLGELPLTDILRFCDRHAVKAPTLARYVRTHGRKLALCRPDLEEHLDALVPRS